MTDGASTLGGDDLFVPRQRHVARRARASNLLDGGAPFYRAYRCADGGFVAVGALEPQFFAALLDGLGRSPRASCRTAGAARTGRRSPPGFEAAFAAKSRDAWAEIFAATDACVTPILSLAEAPAHPHQAARAAFRGDEPATAPRFSRTPGEIGAPLTSEYEAALAARGVTPARIAALREAGAL